MMKLKTTPFDPADFLDTKELQIELLADAVEFGRQPIYRGCAWNDRACARDGDGRARERADATGALSLVEQVGRSASHNPSQRRQIAWSETVLQGGVIGRLSRPPRLGACRGRGGGRVLRPDVARIATAKVGADRGPGAAPEAGQVAGDLDRPVRGRQQMESERDASPGERGMLIEPEQLLHAQGDRRAPFGFVVDRRLGSGRRLEMRRRLVSPGAA